MPNGKNHSGNKDTTPSESEEMSEPKPTPTRQTWFDSIPWWLWVVVVVTHAPMIFFRLDELMTVTTTRERTEAGLMSAQATVWCLLATTFALRAWRRRKT